MSKFQNKYFTINDTISDKRNDLMLLSRKLYRKNK